MPMFIKIDELQNKGTPFISYDELIQEELKDIDCEYEYEIENEFVKINFITEEEKCERRCKDIIIKNLVKDIPGEKLEVFKVKSKEKFFDTVLKQFKTQFGSYSEVLKLYDEAILPGILKTIDIYQNVQKLGGKIVDVVSYKDLLKNE